ncbi:MAG: tRNA (adenosine(37)-N6)-threonylcarbamoyltransferase complex ATPase subunit type 1 TsaE [Oscillospiraceae bacterium]|nr:tRNA (adenosine(37)-N6)-threonylcarbamoyltransferase complex ATPase subunit type 1 TsaE [Oscillospiraceae bacterium]
MKIITKSEKETQEAGAELVKTLAPGSVVAMYGDLGAGKTAFVRGMTRGLGINFPVSSPTFNVVNEYPGEVPMFHFDMYRLGSADELFDIGWDDYLERGGICAVEWSENVEEAFEPGTVKVTISKLGDSEREITVEVME